MIGRRRVIAAALLGVGVLAVTAAVAAAPVAATPGNTVRDGHARFEVLTPTLVRVEYADDDNFQDGATINAVNRDFPTPAYSTEVDDGWRVIKTSQLTLRYKENSGPFTPANTEMDLTVAGQPGGGAPDLAHTAVRVRPGLPGRGRAALRRRLGGE